jgi:hypothetical protein
VREHSGEAKEIGEIGADVKRCGKQGGGWDGRRGRSRGGPGCNMVEARQTSRRKARQKVWRQGRARRGRGGAKKVLKCNLSCKEMGKVSVEQRDVKLP